MEQCRDAMIAEGASTLLDRDRPSLRFVTEAEAEAATCVKRLVNRPPDREPVRTIVDNVLALHQINQGRLGAASTVGDSPQP